MALQVTTARLEGLACTRHISHRGSRPPFVTHGPESSWDLDGRFGVLTIFWVGDTRCPCKASPATVGESSPSSFSSWRIHKAKSTQTCNCNSQSGLPTVGTVPLAGSLVLSRTEAHGAGTQDQELGRFLCSPEPAPSLHWVSVSLLLKSR